MVERETKCKRHSRGLGNDGEWADLLLSELVRGLVGAYVVSVYIYTITYMEQWGLDVILVCILAHGLLGILHVVLEVPMDFVKVDSVVSGMQIGNFGLWEGIITTSGKEWRYACCGKEWRYACCGMWSIIVSKLS